MAQFAFTRIVVGWDGSPGAADSLVMACRLADPTGEIGVVAVVPSFAHVEDAAERDSEIAEIRDPLAARFAEVLAALPAPRARAMLHFVEADNAADALVRWCHDGDYRLVVLGLHGREGEFHRKLGHVAAHVVKAGTCPVLLMPGSVNPPAHEPIWSSVRHALQRPFPHTTRTHPA